MSVFPADATRLALANAVSGDAMTDVVEPTQLLDVEMDEFAGALRALPVPVIGRIQDGAVILDLRCLEDEDGFIAQLAGLALAPAT